MIPTTPVPLGATGRLDLLRSQQFRSHGLRSQRAVATVLRSQGHRCQRTGVLAG